MTPLSAILAFTIAAAILTITPGLDMALVLRTAAVEGPRRALLAGLGICCGVLAWGILAAAGLGAAMAISGIVYDGLRIAGACYLVYLGIGLIRHPRGAVASSGTDSDRLALRKSGGASRWFARGLLTNLLNPKVGIFYVTFLPQFIPIGVDVVGFSALLALIHAILGILWFVALTLATQPLSRWLRRPAVLRTLDRVTGGVFVLFGVRLAIEQR
jgi:threonine/homoserine/homoserine lactone efflux protein